MPYTRALGDELFEIQARGKEGIARIFYGTVVRSKIMILHGFVKKTDKTHKTPRREMATARRRLREVQDENA
jgi:phage-related protein